MVATFKIKKKESSVEKGFLRRCKNKLGVPVKIRKMNGEGNRSWPDRMILGPNGFVAFIEFKRPGENPTEMQANTMDELSQLKFPVAWFDDADKAFSWLKDELNGHITRKIYKR